jgi:diguanylate cyclase (GGDEF)-like protein
MIRILGAERAILFLVDAGSGRLVPQLCRTDHGQEPDELTGYSMTLVEQVASSRRALVVAGTEEGAALGARSVLVHGLRSIIIAPLRLEERLLGVVYLDSRVAKGIFTVDDVDILTAIANHVAVTMETARAAQLETAVVAIRQQRDLAYMLREAMGSLSGTLDQDAVLQRLLDAARRVVAGRRGWLVRPDDPAQAALLAAGGPLLSAGGPLPGTADDGWTAAFTDPPLQLRSWLAVGLTVRGEPVGMLVVADESPDAYGPVQVGTIAALAGHGMVAYENARLFHQVRELAATDCLTQLANRRDFLESAALRVAAAARHGRPLAAIMIDIDHFKRVNDAHGHRAGDDVIRAVAAVLRRCCRRTDLVGRYGGEEFALLLSDAADDAPGAAERLRAEIERVPIETTAGPLTVTISVGVAYREPGDADIDALLARADECLYRAKRSGRNRVVVHGDQRSPVG